jgi:hypothetical protein
MKAAAASLIVLALLIGVIPQFTDCQSQGKAIQLPNGKTLPMKCHWTARAEIAVAVPLLLSGILLISCRHRESRRNAALMTIVSGLLGILLPTVLIGVCAKPDMPCYALMKPTLVLAGSLVVALGAGCFIRAVRQRDANP